MTDKVGVFNKGGAAMQRTVGYRRGMAAVDLTFEFGRRGVTCGGMDCFPGQMEK